MSTEDQTPEGILSYAQEFSERVMREVEEKAESLIKEAGLEAAALLSSARFEAEEIIKEAISHAALVKKEANEIIENAQSLYDQLALRVANLKAFELSYREDLDVLVKSALDMKRTLDESPNDVEELPEINMLEETSAESISDNS